MNRLFKNITLRMRLTILTMVFVTALSGMMVALINRNMSSQIIGIATPMEKIYITPHVPSLTVNADDEQLPTQIELSVKNDDILNTDTIKALKIQKASYVLEAATVEIRQYSYIVFAIVILLGGMLVYYWCGSVLKPVKELSEQMQKRTVNNLNQPIKNENSVAEIKQLSDSFNHMLFNLNHSFEIQKQFNANAAHELRTPIAVLQANIEVLEDDTTPTIGDYDQFLAIAKRSVARMGLLVESLLQMTQLEEMTKADLIDIKALLNKALFEARNLLNEKCINLNKDIADDDFLIYGNETLLYTAIYNIIENAIKYNNPSGEIWASIKKDQKNTTITVRDNGVGISSNELSEIFRPFYRVDKSRARGLGGAGMGLSLVKRIVECHEGTVELESEAGKGSIFKIVLPLLQD